MSLEETVDPQLVRTATTLQVSVVNDHTVQVFGASPHDLVELLLTGPNRVVVNGQDLDPLIDDLSEREIEVLRLIGTGVTNHEVADRMFLSINTVKSYIRSAYRKIGLTSRSQAVIWAIDHGIVPTHRTGEN
jgi:DNA-binding NarL/FixJ family response regulator